MAALAVNAAPPAGYYTNATDKTGAQLRDALHAIIRNHNALPYASSSFDTSDALAVLDQDPANTNNILTLYGPTSEPTASFGLTTGWNREHQWPNSYGLDDVEPAYSDLFNLRAEDATVNSSRGNKFFDVSDTNATSYRFPAHAEAPLCSTDADSWEPPQIVKGDIARAMFYMTVRYTGDVEGEPALRLTDDANLISSSSNFMGRFGTLIKWHLADPVSPEESSRNDLVYSLYQTNRNPFVDHPEWVASAFLPTLTLTPQLTNLLLSWPADHAPEMVAEQKTNLAAPWFPVTNAPVLEGGSWSIALPPPADSRFFRLRLP
jgi:endonuclease I